MLLTEEQAEEKFCPHARTAVLRKGGGKKREQLYANGVNRIAIIHPGGVKDCLSIHSLCQASRCMAWRFEKPDQFLKRTYEKAEAVARETGRHRHEVQNEVMDDLPRRGYCGAFGKPEA